MSSEPKTYVVLAELVANVIEVYVAPGDVIEPGATVLLLESMKMEIPVLTEEGGTVSEVKVEPGAVVQEGHELVVLTQD